MTLFLQLEIQLDNQNLQSEVLNFGGFIEEKQTTAHSVLKYKQKLINKSECI
jgi:hypothetical protein